MNYGFIELIKPGKVSNTQTNGPISYHHVKIILEKLPLVCCTQHYYCAVSTATNLSLKKSVNLFLQAKLDELLSKKRDIQSNKEAVDDENRKKASNILSNGLAVVFENR